MTQEIKNIALKELVLWTENPRDPISVKSTDQEIANRAINEDQRTKWSLKKLFNKMGKRFDQSEIPTVAYIEEKPVVFDGNRRVLIGKIINRYIGVKNCPDFSSFEFPTVIPCNVCDKQTALEHVDRKHADSGSWGPLERDIFKHNEMREAKSPFLIIEEKTKIISSNPELNQRFVKEEIFDQTNLHKIGFSLDNGEFKHAYQNEKDAETIIENIINLVRNKDITTRKNRGKIEKLLKENKITHSILDKKQATHKTFSPDAFQSNFNRKTSITKGKKHELFGKKLSLQPGQVNNIYSDILKLYKEKEKPEYSKDFPTLIRMSIRLLCEISFQNWECFVKNEFTNAKQKLSQDQKTTLHSQTVNENNIVSLIQAGAHGYTASNNIDQTVAISLIIGILLSEKHGKES